MTRARCTGAMRQIRVLILVAVLLLGGCRALAHVLVDIAFDAGTDSGRSCDLRSAEADRVRRHR